MKEKISNALGLLLYLGLIIGIPAWVILSAVYNYYRVDCNKVPIQYETQDVTDNNLGYSVVQTIQNGVNGSKVVCMHESNAVYSSTVVAQPVAEVIHRGPDYTGILNTTDSPPSDDYSGGSTCRDGTHSPSTGRGTCSWHGGVAY